MLKNEVKLVGILNITPDSFSDGGLYFSPEKALAQAKRLFRDGAAIIDVGAESTNPTSQPLSPQDEWDRLRPVLGTLCTLYPKAISVDTHHASTAEHALRVGATYINDVTMFRDPAMVKLAGTAKNNAHFIVSHLSPLAATLADAHKYTPTSTMDQVRDELLAKQSELVSWGVPLENIILDPGIGFGKSSANNWALNWQLLKFAEEVPGSPVMIGHSRKRFLGEHRMELDINIEAARIAIDAGAQYLRVHDVKAHRDLLRQMEQES